MKIKGTKRFLSFLMVCVMLMCVSTTAFAATVDDVKSDKTNIVTVVPRANTALGAGKSVTFNLGNVPGYYDTILTIVTASETTSGHINWTLKCNGNAIDSGTLGVNDMLTKAKVLSSGTYTIEITNVCSKTTTVYAFFD